MSHAATSKTSQLVITRRMQLRQAHRAWGENQPTISPEPAWCQDDSDKLKSLSRISRKAVAKFTRKMADKNLNGHNPVSNTVETVSKRYWFSTGVVVSQNAFDLCKISNIPDTDQVA